MRRRRLTFKALSIEAEAFLRRAEAFLRQAGGQILKFAGRVIRLLPSWANLLTIALAAWAVYQARVVMVPSIQPDSAISSSSADLPISASNTGAIFDMTNVHFFCDVTNVTWKAIGTTPPWKAFRAVGKAEFTVPGPPREMQPGFASTFPCNVASDIVVSDPNGTRLPVALIHMSIRTTYTIKLGWFHWRRQAESQVFSWQAVSGGFQWLAGDTGDTVQVN
jgi:hypothetical protein